LRFEQLRSRPAVAKIGNNDFFIDPPLIKQLYNNREKNHD